MLSRRHRGTGEDWGRVGKVEGRKVEGRKVEGR
jgi:hypothetical protein